MIWGYAGVWPKEFTPDRPPSLMSRLQFLVQWGLQCTGAAVSSLERMEPAERDAVFAALAEHDLHLTLGVWGFAFVDADEARRRTDAALEGLRRYKDAARAPIVTTGAGGPHRFERTPPLE